MSALGAPTAASVSTQNKGGDSGSNSGSDGGGGGDSGSDGGSGNDSDSGRGSEYVFSDTKDSSCRVCDGIPGAQHAIAAVDQARKKRQRGAPQHSLRTVTGGGGDGSDRARDSSQPSVMVLSSATRRRTALPGPEARERDRPATP